MASKSGKARGLLIVVEGLDRSGKSTQCQLLVARLQEMGRSVQYVKFPNRDTPSGQLINSYLTGEAQTEDHAIHLLFSANRWEAVKDISDEIARGTTVVVDRYSFSGAVYSAAKQLPNLSLQWAWHPEIGMPQPDITLFLDISAEVAARRGGYGAERYEKANMQSRVRTLFQQLFETVSRQQIETVDAGRSIDAVAKEILNHVLMCEYDGPLTKLEPLKYNPK